MTEVVDRAGRKLVLRKFGMLEYLRLYKALGGELASNDSYVGLSKTVSRVAMIDNVPLPFPVNEAAVEALIERVGDDGVAAIEAALASGPLAETVADAGN